MITFDKNLQYQQNFSKYNFPIIVINANDNTYLTVSKLSDKIIKVLTKKNLSGIIEIKE